MISSSIWTIRSKERGHPFIQVEVDSGVLAREHLREGRLTSSDGTDEKVKARHGSWDGFRRAKSSQDRISLSGDRRASSGGRA